MSSIVKATKVILDNRKFTLSPEIAPPAQSFAMSQKVVTGDELTGAEAELLERIEVLRVEAGRVIEDAHHEAREIVESAGCDSSSIINDAYVSAKTILEDAKEQGYREGFETGMAEAHESMASMMAEARRFKEDMMAKYSERLELLESEIVGLVTVAVEKILNMKMDKDGEYIEGLIRSAISKSTYTERLVLRISPEDYGNVILLKDRIIAMFERIEDIEVRQDTSLQKGSCVLDTISGSIDSSISTQLKMVGELLDEALRSE